MVIVARQARPIVFIVSVVVLGLAASALAQENEALPPEARAVLDEFGRTQDAVEKRLEEKIAPLRQAAEQELKPARAAAAKKLQKLLEQYTRAGKLDEALALREAVRRVLGILPDPGVLHLQESDIGKTFVFEVRGSTKGSVWGSEVYTSDSHLGTAAVHSGLLAPGQKGVVKVRVLGAQKEFFASTRNGVTTLPYGPWPVSFTLEAQGD